MNKKDKQAKLIASLIDNTYLTEKEKFTLLITKIVYFGGMIVFVSILFRIYYS